MRSLRCACIVATAAPLLIASCTDLKGLSNAAPEGNANGDGGPEASVTGCAAGTKMCAGTCVALDDPAFGCGDTSCERCSLPFARELKCGVGKCLVATCEPGHADCNGRGDDGCEAMLGSAETCGNCTVACGPDRPYCDPLGACVADCGSFTLCGTSCVDLSTSDVNCGACGKVCPSASNAVGQCADAKCKLRCNAGFDDCDATTAGCEPLVPYFHDGDLDGFGAGPIVGEGCAPPPGSSLLATDCLDSNPAVKPGQTTFFSVGYTNAAGQTSYDYDCSGTETTNATTALASCNVVGCTTGARAPAPARANPPPGANAYCGSTTAFSLCSGSCSYTSASPVGCR